MNYTLDSIKQLVKNCKGVILDIEGTTTPVDFVKKQLFSYAEIHLSDFLKNNWNDCEVQDSVKEIIEQSIKDSKENLEGFVPLPTEYPVAENIKVLEEYQISIVLNLKWQMLQDRKTTGLKKIQGLILREGYTKGLILGQLYEDVLEAFQVWSNAGKKIYIYSSGSKLAQVYLFQYSIFGDLRKYIKEHFDTNIGSKFEPSSYKKICENLKISPKELIFFTDHPREIWAANKIGLKSVLVERDPAHPFSEFDQSVLGLEVGKINSFQHLVL